MKRAAPSETPLLRRLLPSLSGLDPGRRVAAHVRVVCQMADGCFSIFFFCSCVTRPASGATGTGATASPCPKRLLRLTTSSTICHDSLFYLTLRTSSPSTRPLRATTEIDAPAAACVLAPASVLAPSVMLPACLVAARRPIYPRPPTRPAFSSLPRVQQSSSAALLCDYFLRVGVWARGR